MDCFFTGCNNQVAKAPAMAKNVVLLPALRAGGEAVQELLRSGWMRREKVFQDQGIGHSMEKQVNDAGH